jgi:ketosteroid isomerase-like protein
MRQCPLCKTTYSDDNLIYCLADGTGLIPLVDEQATFVRRSSEPIRVQVQPDTQDILYMPMSQPQQFVPMAQPAASSSGILKVLVAILVLGFVFLLVIGGVGAWLYFSYGKQTVAVANTSPTANAPLFANSNINGKLPTPSPAITTPTSTPEPEQTPTPIAEPTVDKAAVTSELTDIGKRIIRSAIKGDTSTLADLTTDDFTQTDPSGKVRGKKAVIAESKNSTETRDWTFTFGKVELVSADQDTAVIRYRLTLSPPYSEPDTAKMTETYVRVNGRWLLRSQKISN